VLVDEAKSSPEGDEGKGAEETGANIDSATAKNADQEAT